MSEKLMNVQEVCQDLGISEEELRSLVDRGKIPAYRLGGTILRFKQAQIDAIKAKGVPRVNDLPEEKGLSSAGPSRMDKIKDFFYFNDFYIISAIVIIVLLIVIFFY